MKRRKCHSGLLGFQLWNKTLAILNLSSFETQQQKKEIKRFKWNAKPWTTFRLPQPVTKRSPRPPKQIRGSLKRDGSITSFPSWGSSPSGLFSFSSWLIKTQNIEIPIILVNCKTVSTSFGNSTYLFKLFQRFWMIKYGCIKNMYFNKIYFHMKIYISIPWKHRSRVNCYKKYCISVFYFIALKVPNGLWSYGAKMEVMFFTNLLSFEYQFLWCGDKVGIVKQLKFKQSTYLRPGNHTQKFFF